LLISPKTRQVVTATDRTREMEKLPVFGENPAIDRFLAGYEGSALMRNPAGIEMLAADKHIATTGWIAASVLPTSEAFAAVAVMRQRLLFGATLFILLVGGLVWWILRRHLSPLLSTARMVAEMAQPDSQLHALPVLKQDEIGTLIAGFNRLIATLGRRETALRDSHQTLQKILATTLDGFWRADLHGQLLEVNPAYCRMSGYMREDLLTMRIADLEASEQEQDTRAHIERVMQLGSDQFESIHRRKDGSTWFVEISAVYDARDDGQFFVFLRDITERRLNAENLEKSEKRLSTIFPGAADAIFITDSTGKYQFVNQAGVDMLGYTREEILSKNIGDISHSDDASRAKSHFTDLLSTGALRADYWLQKKSGENIAVALNATLLPDGTVFGSCRDITERKQNEEKLHLAASVFTHAREGIMITSADGTIIEVNATFVHITGYSREEVLGKNPRILSSGLQDKQFYTELWSDLERDGHWSGEVWNRRKNGEVFAEMQTISVVRDAHGEVKNYVALFSDITSQKENQHKLEHIAHFDALTNLPNRVLLADRLHQSMLQVKRRNQRLGVAYIDLDGFKVVNDRYGHATGDRLLVFLGEKLKHVLRDGDTLARIGGDEFVVVLSDLDEIADCTGVLNRLLLAAAQPVHVGEEMVQVSASVGVSFYPQSEEVDGEQLIRQADQAMYQAKQTGKNRFHIFDAELDRSVRGHHEGLEHIREALTRQEFVLYYQPKVDMRKGSVVGAEALVRWQHPTQGLLAPALFLPLIEEDVLSIELGEWVIASALRQIETWHAAGLAIPISVNVGALQLQHPQFIAHLRQQLAAHPKVRPGDLELELLETSALEDLANVSKVIEQCNDLGITFALDDFGTGYSSLTYLKRLPITLLKIDQGFVRDMLDDPDDMAILVGVIGLSDAFQREVIAEGVETVEHGEMLLRLGCDLAQGYGIARPMPAHVLPAWREGWQVDPSWLGVPRASRDDFPMLLARVELRAWIKFLENYVTDKRKAPPSLDHELCPFGVWLGGHGIEQYGKQPHFLMIAPLHRQLHGLAARLYAFKTQGVTTQAIAGLDELNELASALLQQLNNLIRDTNSR
jgi:diguanylate cyclase (GGDEF)-like protein/PAS domain S-box-containing protein